MGDNVYIDLHNVESAQLSDDKCPCVEGQPPAKRRRITDSIISTALSVALVSTAVGYTAYKLWRDRGKTNTEEEEQEQEQARQRKQKQMYQGQTRYQLDRQASLPPPPPYVAEEWLDEPHTSLRTGNNVSSGGVGVSEFGRMNVPVTPRSRYSRHGKGTAASQQLQGTGSVSKSSASPSMARVHRRLRSGGGNGGSISKRRTINVVAPGPSSPYASSSFAQQQQQQQLTQVESQVPHMEQDDCEVEVEGNQSFVDEQMDWMSERLRNLIAEGQKALGREVVVAVEGAKNVDESVVDDGLEGWEDEEDNDDHRGGSFRLGGGGSVRSRIGNRSLKRGGGRSTPITPIMTSGFGTPTVMTTNLSSTTASLLRTPRRQAPEEEEEDIDSRELRETMERVRESYRLRMAAASGSSGPGSISFSNSGPRSSLS